MKKHIEIKTIEHKDISVVVKIDYDAGTATLCDLLHANGDTQVQPKKWVFASRGLEYMNGWLNILEAMKFAVETCKKDLEWDLAEKSKFRDSEISKSLIKPNHRKNANKK